MTRRPSNSLALPQPGAPGLGDSLYPNFGNGGYDVQNYDLDLNIRNVTTSALNGLTKIQAKATQNLTLFNHSKQKKMYSANSADAPLDRQTGSSG